MESIIFAEHKHLIKSFNVRTNKLFGMLSIVSVNELIPNGGKKFVSIKLKACKI